MEKRSIGRIIDMLGIIHQTYEESYTKYGITTGDGKALMEKIFQDTYKSVINKITKKGN